MKGVGEESRFFPAFRYEAKPSRAEKEKGLEGRARKEPGFGKDSLSGISATIQGARLGNAHPTVKPTGLMRWLLKLIVPPGGSVLDPFAGSGTTGLAADQLGIDAVLVEQDAEYAALARDRIRGDCPLFAEVE